jgi:hypothetical protein
METQLFFFSCRLFTEDEVDQINNITLYDVILMATKIDETEIQEDPFFVCEFL